MTEKNDQIIAELLKVETPPLPVTLKERTLDIARTNLPPYGKKPLFIVFADYMPPAPLVPSLLISVAVVFVVDVVSKVARFFGIS